MREGTGLEKKLDQYAVAAKGRITEGRSLAEIAGYAAAAGASLGLAGTADAAIIYSGVLNQSVMISPAAASTATNLSFPMDGAGNGFLANVSFALNTTAFTSFASSMVNGNAGVQANGVAAFLGANPNAADKLAAGAVISAGGTFSALFGGNQRYQTVTSSGLGPNFFGNISNPFTNGVSAFVGIKLGTGATASYGWIRLILEDLADNPVGALGADGANYFDKVTIVDWAYDDTGAAITAGATAPALNAPDSLALLALGAAGMGAFRRRKVDSAKQA
jgi:hypothetical protein